MRTYTVEGEHAYINIKYPDAVCFSGNYNSIIIDGADEYAYFDIKYNNFSIRAYLYGGNGEVHISSILKSLFVNTSSRSVIATIKVVKPDGTNFLTFSTCVIDGWLPAMDRIFDIGAYDASKNQPVVRRLRWFANFPFNFSYFAYTTTDVYKRTDSGEYSKLSSPTTNKIVDVALTSSDATSKIVYKLQNAEPTSEFDETYNYPFLKLCGKDSLIYLMKDESKDGNYIRWIDNKGFYNYFLFDKGSKIDNASYGSDVKVSSTIVNGIQFKVETPISIKRDVKYKCAACNLNKDDFELVSTISTARKAELFLGYGSGNAELWMPISIEKKEIEDVYKKPLQNIEIEFTIVEIDDII